MINTVVANSVVIPLEIMECLNKSEWKQIKLLLGKTQPALYYACEELRFEKNVPGCVQL